MRPPLDELTNPPLWAVRCYRAAHWLHRRGWRFLPALLSTFGRVITGIEISPAAQIGRPFNIGHGVGVVIGEAVVIGNGCSVLQGVTLGNRDPLVTPTDGRPYQPVLRNGVVVCANAVVAGPVTIGDGAIIGANSVVLCDVPAGCTAVGNPARVLPPRRQRTPTQTSSGSVVDGAE